MYTYLLYSTDNVYRKMFAKYCGIQHANFLQTANDRETEIVSWLQISLYQKQDFLKWKSWMKDFNSSILSPVYPPKQCCGAEAVGRAVIILRFGTGAEIIFFFFI